MNVIYFAAVFSHSVAVEVADLMCNEKFIVGQGRPTWGISSGVKFATPVTTSALSLKACAVSKCLKISAKAQQNDELGRSSGTYLPNLEIPLVTPLTEYNIY